MSRRAVFLDRDGVLVDALIRGDRAYAPVSLEQFKITEGAGPLVERLRGAGLLPIVFTNQPDVARGMIAPALLQEMHARLREAVAVEDVFVCMHDSAAGCDCRKPKPGMLRAAAAKWGIDLSRSFVIGDRWQDVDAGRAVGCRTVLIGRSYSGPAEPDIMVADLTGAVDAVLRTMEDEGVEFVKRYLDEVVRVTEAIDRQAVARLVDLLVDVRRRGGRLFILGVGGSAANASHAVNDFRKIVGLEAYTPVDNVVGADRPYQRRRLGLVIRQLAPGEPADRSGLCAGVLRRWRRSRAQRQREPGSRGGIRQVGGGPGRRDRGTERRVHQQGGRRVRDRPDGEPGDHHPPYRSVPGGDLASAGRPSPPAGHADEVGKPRAMSPAFPRVVVLGASGHVGSALVKVLHREGVDVIGHSSKSLDLTSRTRWGTSRARWMPTPRWSWPRR